MAEKHDESFTLIGSYLLVLFRDGGARLFRLRLGLRGFLPFSRHEHPPWSAGDGVQTHLRFKQFGKILGSFFSAFHLDVAIEAWTDLEDDAMAVDFDSDVAHRLVMTAIERFGDAKNRDQSRHRRSLGGAQPGEV